MTKFYVDLGHPAYNPSLLMLSTDLQATLNQGDLSPHKLPKLSSGRNKHTGNMAFIYESDKSYVQEDIKIFINNIVTKVLKQQKDLAEIDISSPQPDIQEYEPPTNKLSKRVIARIPIDEILMDLTISFGGTNLIQPAPVKTGIYGMLAGLLLALCWIIISVLRQALIKKNL